MAEYKSPTIWRKCLFAPGSWGSTHSLWFVVQHNERSPRIGIRIGREVTHFAVRLTRGRQLWIMARYLKRNAPGRVTIRSGVIDTDAVDG